MNSERKSVVWKCSKGFGAGQYKKEPCGRANAQWTIFDPNIGGNRNRRWLGRCPCGKVTAINPEAGNILKVCDTRNEGILWAAKYNSPEYNNEKLLMEENPPTSNVKWFDPNDEIKKINKTEAKVLNSAKKPSVDWERVIKMLKVMGHESLLDEALENIRIMDGEL
jgi:hypothetical protein